MCEIFIDFALNLFYGRGGEGSERPSPADVAATLAWGSSRFLLGCHWRLVLGPSRGRLCTRKGTAFHEKQRFFHSCLYV